MTRTSSETGKAPAVSVVIPAYEASRHITSAIESVLAQTCDDYEIIVVNDGSPDTAELERVLEPYRDRIVYLTRPNGGCGAARNTAIRVARGEFIAQLDSDDLWEPAYLAEQLRMFREDPTLDLVYTDAIFFGDTPRAGARFMQSSPSEGPVTFESVLSLRCTVMTPSVMARRQAMLDAGLYDESIRYCEDIDLYLRMLHRGARFAYQRKPLVRYRLHSYSISADRMRLFRAQVQVYTGLGEKLALTPHQRELLDAQLARARASLHLEQARGQFIAQRYEQAAENLARANLYFRRQKLRLAVTMLRFAPRLLHFAYRLRGTVS